MAKATSHRPDGVQTVHVPWEWGGEPGEETSGPIFARMELPRVGGALPTSRRLGLPAPDGVTYYRFDVPRACVGRLTYRYQRHEVTQLVHLVKGFNVVELRRHPALADMPDP
ncbi:MAG: hypothetical protein ACTHN0_17275 [Aquihabitans sp.]